ncbi:MAG: hypothetical protein K2Y18_07250 [Alphaproteobacteria bacterium]|nr:hypothetical protein [Alphaproteobacteria bacterium]
MADIVKKDEELLTKNENLSSSEVDSTLQGDGKTRDKSKKDESNQAKDYRRKKQDALQGKENKSVRGQENEPETGKRGGGEKGGEKGGKSGGSGPGQAQNLQTGQTTVQFSSGGGGVGNFGSLLALFASSSNLARADIGGFRIISNQLNNLNLRSDNQAAKGSLLGDGKESQKVILGGAVEQTVENAAKQFVAEAAGSGSHSKASVDDSLKSLLSGLSAHAATGAGDEGKSKGDSITIANLGGFTYIQSFNSNNLFFPADLVFTFTNQSTGQNGIVKSYFTAANLGTFNEYTYQVISPIIDVGKALNASGLSGFTAIPSSTDELAVNILRPQDGLRDTIRHRRIVNPDYQGLTLTADGDVLSFNITKPMSILVKATPVGGNASSELVFRVNAGPGDLVTSTTGFGTLDPSGEFNSAVFRINGSAMTGPIAGLASVIDMIDGSGTVGFLNGSGLHSFSILPTGDEYAYSFPSNTIFRHLGTSLTTIPTSDASGQFGVANIVLPEGTKTYDLKMGGNVLDVYGNKLGVGDTLNLSLPSGNGSTSGPHNIITLGDNTLGGFGLSVGDLKTLTLFASDVSAGNTITPTDIIFRGNILYADKSVDSTFYPHIEDLNMLHKPLSPTMTTPTVGQFNNVNITFQDSIINGNLGKDTFYGDIQHLGDLNDFGIPAGVDTVNKPFFSGRYNGFITGVNVTDVDGHVVITTLATAGAADVGSGITNGGINSITWANDVYVGGYNPDQDNSKNLNTYNFTLLGDTIRNPIMQGHALITDFDLAKDTFKFQLTPDLFRSLDTDHNKSISMTDLDSGVNFLQNSLFPNRLLGTNVDVSGTMISFKGGGSINLMGVDLASFADISKVVTTEVYLTYIPVAALPLIEITPVTPSHGQPFVYGNGPLNMTGVTTPYYNELDNYFSNSLFATYTVTGLPSGVTIDPWGSITVTTTTPVFAPLTITATDDHGGTATSDPLLFGFLNAPVLEVPDGATRQSPDFTSNNIYVGGLNSTIIGIKDTLLIGPNQGGTTNIASNMIINTEGGTSYGDFRDINITAQGTSGSVFTLTNIGTAQSPVLITSSQNQAGVINGYNLNINGNAFYTYGTTYGVAQNLHLTAQGGTGSQVQFTAGFQQVGTYDNRGVIYGSTINIGPETIFGNGTIYGGVQRIDIDVNAGVSAGTRRGFSINAASFGGNVPYNQLSGNLDTGATFQNNSITFQSLAIKIVGDVTGQTSTIYSFAEVLDVTEYKLAAVIGQRAAQSSQTTPPPSIADSSLSYSGNTIFTGNHFVFEGSTFSGGKGNTIFYGNLKEFGNPYDPTSLRYNGFVNGVTVTSSTGVLTNGVLTISDPRDGNSITWANNTYNPGMGTNEYNFTLVPNGAGDAVMQGFQTISSFNPVTDKITLNLTQNLAGNLGFPDSGATAQTLAALLDQDVQIVSDGAGGTLILFPAGGGIDLKGFTFTGPQTLASLIAQFPTTLSINGVGAAYVPLAINNAAYATFDHAHVNFAFTDIYKAFVANGNQSNLTFSVAGVTGVLNTTTHLMNYTLLPGVGNGDPPQIYLDSEGTLTIALTITTPIYLDFNLTVYDGRSTVTTTTPIPLFALNTTTPEDMLAGNTTNGFIVRNLENAQTLSGTTATQAYEASDATTIFGGGDNIVFDGTHATSTTPLSYGSKLIYSVGAGDRKMVADVSSIQFTHDGTHTAGLNGQTITFGANMIKSTTGTGSDYGIFGNAESLIMTASGARGGGGPRDANIHDNIINFGPNTEYGSGNFYGNLKSLTLSITDPSIGPNTVGNATIEGNTFNFSANKLTADVAGPSNLYAGIGTLTIVNTETSAYTRTGTSQITGNAFNFSNSTLKAGVGATMLFSDIADMSNTTFALQPVTLVTTAPPGVVEIKDAFDNTITWGNNTFYGNTGVDTFTFTILSLGGGQGAMQGNATIENYTNGIDTINFKLSPDLFKALNLDFDRTLTPLEFQNPNFIHFTPEGANMRISFAQNAGSILIKNYTGISPVASAAYKVAPIAVIDPAPLLALVLSTTIAGNVSAVTTYGNILDTYFANVDISNAGSTYAITNYFDATITTAFPQLGIQYSSQLNPIQGGIESITNFGTINVSALHQGASVIPNAPILTPIVVTAHDPNGPDQTITLMLGVFDTSNGTIVAEPTTGNYTGSLTGPSYLQGSRPNETMIGNANNLTFAPTPGQAALTQGYGTTIFGGNVLINKSADTTAYGNFNTITFNMFADSPRSTTSSNENTVANQTWVFGQNALDINGTAYGIADRFLIDVENKLNGQTVVVNPSFVNDSAGFNSNTIYLGQPISFNDVGHQTMYGQGTMYGTVNSLEINLVAGQNVTATTTLGATTYDASAYMHNNIFQISSTYIAITGNEPSSIYSSINSLSIYERPGTVVLSQTSQNVANVTLDAVFDGNVFTLHDSVAVGGLGGTNFYPGINDLSRTSFWDSDLSVIQNGTHFGTSYTNLASETNTINWANNTVFLDSGPAGANTTHSAADTIHIDLLNSAVTTTQGQTTTTTFYPIMEGNLTVYYFDPAMDKFSVDLSPHLYNQIGTITDTSFSTLSDVSLAVNTNSQNGPVGTTIYFDMNGTSASTDHGSIFLAGYTGSPTLVDFSTHVQLGTTFVGTSAVDTVTLRIPDNGPDNFADFKEFNHIVDFDNAHDILRLVLPDNLYNVLSDDGTLNGNVTAAALQSGVGNHQTSSHLQVAEVAAQFAPTHAGPGMTAMDTVISFVTNGATTGSITIHNMGITDLNQLQHLVVAHA